MSKRERARDQDRERDGEGDGRQRLLAAARDLFLARGYAAVSIGEISAAAGMTRAAPYYHFKDKEDLFLHVFAQEISQLLTEMTAIVQSALPFRERLIRILVYAIEIKGADTGRLFDDLERHVSAERRQEIIGRLALERPQFGNPFAIFRPLFAEGVATGEIRRVSPDLAATVFLATVSGLMEMIFREKHTLPVELRPAEVVDVLLHGF